MALIQTEMNMVNSGGTSDVIVPNAIANLSDDTSSGLITSSTDDTLQVGTTENTTNPVISKKIFMGSNTLGTEASTIDIVFGDALQDIFDENTKYEAIVQLCSNGYTANFSFIGYALFTSGTPSFTLNFGGNIGKYRFLLSTVFLDCIGLSGGGDKTSTTLTFTPLYTQISATPSSSTIDILSVKLYKIIE